MGKIKTVIENNFSILLILGAISGFFLPSFGSYSDEIVILFTAILIFMSCANIDPPDFLKIDVFQISLFTLVRYAIFPLVLFYVVHSFLPEYSIGILLLALMPAGVTVSAFCSMAGANVALGLSLTVISSLLAPFFIPGVFSFLGQVVSVDVWGLFLTLVCVVFVPIGLYFGVARRSKILEEKVRRYNKSTSIILLSLILLIVVATQKDEFLADIQSIYIGLIVMTAVIGLFYLVGIAYAYFVPKGQKIPYILASGAMNNSLAVGLAFAYFDARVTLFIVLSEIVWSAYVAITQWILSKRSQ